MKFKILLQSLSRSADWWETYILDDSEVTDPWKWAHETVARFNAGVDGGLSGPKRVLVDLVIIDRDAMPTDHAWEKQNNFSLSAPRGGIFDRFRCLRCGVTAKRSGVGAIRIDSKYRAKVYRRCDTSIEFQRKKQK